MPLLSDDLSADALHRLTREIRCMPAEHHLHKELMDGAIRIFKDGDYAVFHSAGGFYFRHMTTGNLEETVHEDIHGVRDYLCTAFTVDSDDPTVVQKLLNRFEENHGARMAKMIEHLVLTFEGKRLMLVKLPSCIVRHMLEPTGGVLRTKLAGPVESLAELPTLGKLGVQIEEFADTVIATEYQEGYYILARRMHFDILKEVLAHPNKGIVVKMFAVWDSF